ncbi:MAG TPA: hypothetical protein VIK86_05800 [Candidatus Paceibacterota bacterium]
MRKLFAFITIILMTFTNIWYVHLIVSGIIHPTLMTWVMFCVAVILSFATYWSSEKHSFLNNACNTVDLISVIVITSTIIFFGKDVRFNINMIEIICIALSLVILFFWRITRKHETSNMLLQIVMSIAYLPTFYQLWVAYESSESLITWSVMWFASITGVTTGILGKDKLATIYSFRSFLLISILIILILRLN